jgi:hypothetical protein
MHHAAAVQRRLVAGVSLSASSAKDSVEAVLYPKFMLQSSNRCVEARMGRVVPKKAAAVTMAAGAVESETIASVERFERMHRLVPVDDD